MSYQEMERRLTELERAAELEQCEVDYEQELAGLPPLVQAAIRGLKPEDRKNWVEGMLWFGSLPGHDRRES